RWPRDWSSDVCSSDLDHAMVRLTMLLQNAAFVPLFRAAAGKLPDTKIDEFKPGDAAGEVSDVFATASKDHSGAARKALAYLQGRSEERRVGNEGRTGG